MSLLEEEVLGDVESVEGCGGGGGGSVNLVLPDDVLYATDEEEAAFLEMLSNSISASSLARSISHSPDGSPCQNYGGVVEEGFGGGVGGGSVGVCTTLPPTAAVARSSPRAMISRSPHLPVRETIRIFEVDLVGVS